MEQMKTMNEIEEIVYRGYGLHQRNGGGFSTFGVKTKEAYEEALKDGWFKTLPEAIEAHDKKSHAQIKENPVAVKADEDAVFEPVVEVSAREALEAKASGLGIRFHPNISDEKLRLRIEGAKGIIS
jgi:hypothetical protein